MVREPAQRKWNRLQDRTYFRGISFGEQPSTRLATTLTGLAITHATPAASPRPSQPIGPLTPSVSSIQQGGRGDLPNVFVVAPREVQRPLNQAAEAIAAENYTEAVSLLGGVLTSPETEDFFLPAEYGRGTLMSIKVYALEMVRQLPPRGREIYELRFGSEAAASLEQAVAENNFADVARVAEQFFHTEAGYQAMLLLGRHHLDQGRALQAARCFARVVEATSGSDDMHLEATLLRSTALQRAGREMAARDQLEPILQEPPQRSIAVSGESFTMRDRAGRETYLQQIQAWLDAAGRHQGENKLTDWALYGGDAARNAVSAGGTPLLDPLWRVPINDAEDEGLTQQIANQFVDDKLAAISSVHPLVIRDTVLIRTPNKVFGINLQTGKRVWPYPWEDDLFGHSLRQDAIATVGVNARKTQLLQRLWEDSIYGQMTSDGKQVYFVDGLGYATMNEFSTAQGVPGQVRVRALSARSTNHLVGIQLVDERGRSVEGKLAWRVGDVNGMDEPRLAGVFFLGPPLPMDGMLYALAEIRDEIQLVVLNQHTGTLEWSQQLASVEEVGTVHNSGIRRLAGAVPSFGEGVLVCPTSAGAVVAIDPATRSLLWGFQFPTRERLSQSAFAANSFRGEEKRPGEKWSDGSIIVSNGCALLTPVESNAIYCLDVRTGQMKWDKPLPRNDGLFVAGIRDGIAVIVGHEFVRGVRLDDAIEVWKLSIESIGRPSGRAVINDQDLFLPTTNARLIRLNIDTGQVEQVVDTERTLGNLVSVQGRIISCHHDFVAAYDQDLAAKREAELRLSRNADDARGLAIEGQLALHDERWNDAVTALTRSYEISPTAAHASLLTHCLLQGLEDDIPQALDVLAPYEQLLLESPARQQYLRLRIETLINNDRLREGFEVLVQHYLEEVPTASDSQVSQSSLVPQTSEQELSLSQERWAQTIINRIRNQAEPEIWNEIEAQIRQLGQRVLAQRDPSLLERYRLVFGQVLPNAAINLQLARHLLANERVLEATLSLQQLRQVANPQIQAESLVLLMQTAASTDRYAAAANYASQLDEQFQQIELADGRSVPTAVQQMREQNPALDHPTPSSQWPSGEIEISESGDLIGRTSFPIEYFPIKSIRSQHDGTLPITIDHDRRNEGIIRDADGRELLRFSLRENPASVPFYGSSLQTSRYIRRDELVVIVSGYDLMAIDLNRVHGTAEDALIWRHSLLPDIVPDPTSRLPKQRLSKKGFTSPLGWSVDFAVDTSWQRLGAIGPLAELGFCYLKRNQLICIHPVSGELLWKRSDIARDSDLIGNEQWIAVLDSDYSAARIFSLVDGKEIKKTELQVARNPLVIYDTRILSYDAREDHVTLQLYDVFSERITWEEVYVSGTRATRVDDDRFAVLEPSGQFTIRSLRDGSELMRAELPEDYDTQSIEVVEMTEALLLFTNDNATSTTLATLTGDKPLKIHIPNEIGPLVKGSVYAFDKQTREFKWTSPAIIHQFCVPDRWTRNSPFIPLIRHHQARTERGSISPLHTELVVLDVRDGRLVLHRDDIPQNTSMMHLETSPDRRAVKLELNEKKFDFIFTDRPREKGAPADTSFGLNANANQATEQ